jgi:hypothetical protein
VPDFVADYGRIPIGEMIGQLFAVNGLTGGADPISYTYDPGETYVVADYVIPGGTALDVGQQLAAYDVAGVLWERQSGEIVYSDGTSRAYPTPSEGTLSLQTSGSFGPPAILDEWIAEQTMAGVINAAVITWGNGAGTVTLRDATSIGTWGEYAYYADMPIDSEIDAQTVASRWVANYSDPAITVTPLVIELSIPNAPIATALSAVVGTIVDFLPGPPPIPLMPDACYLEGYTETITQTGHRLELDVSDVRLSRAPQTWATVAPATTWNSVASMYPTLTWYEQIGVPL